MPLVCPKCRLINPDAATHCDCGRALAPDAVDRNPPAPAVVRTGRRPKKQLVIAVAVAVALVGFGVWWQLRGKSPLAHLRSICGDSYKVEGKQHGGRHLAATCKVKARGHDVLLDFATEGDEVVYARARIFHGKPDVQSLRDHALDVLGPLLGDAQRNAARRLIATVEPATSGYRREAIGGVVLQGALRLQVNAPERRYVDLLVTTEPDYFERTDMPPQSWPTGLEVVEPATVDAIGAWCRDDAAMSKLVGTLDRPIGDRWSTGDLWLACNVAGANGLLRIEVIWNPQRRAASIHVDAPAPALETVLDRVARPLVPPSARHLITSNADSDTPQYLEQFRLFVHANEGGTTVEIDAQ